MFERYTERARQMIVLTRYEAAQFGSTTIETEHLLLALIMDSNLVSRFLRTSGEVIRREIEGRITIREKVSTSVDLPLSNECKRILAYAAEEREVEPSPYRHRASVVGNPSRRELYGGRHPSTVQSSLK